MSTEAFAEGSAARHSRNSRDPFHAGGRFRGFHGSHICHGLPVCSAPCTDLTGLPANGAFYIQAFNGSVALPAVGYDYNIDWTPMLVGLSPTRMAASLAARPSHPAYPRSARPRHLEALETAGFQARVDRYSRHSTKHG